MITGTVTDDAERLNTSQPAVSRLISELERSTEFTAVHQEKRRPVAADPRSRDFFPGGRTFLYPPCETQTVRRIGIRNIGTGYMRITCHGGAGHGLQPQGDEKIPRRRSERFGFRCRPEAPRPCATGSPVSRWTSDRPRRPATCPARASSFSRERPVFASCPGYHRWRQSKPSFPRISRGCRSCSTGPQGPDTLRGGPGFREGRGQTADVHRNPIRRDDLRHGPGGIGCIDHEPLYGP